MEFLGVSSRSHIAGGGSSTIGWSSSSFAIQGTGAASDAASLLKQVEQEKLLQGKK